jgi:hypothetical protein
MEDKRTLTDINNAHEKKIKSNIGSINITATATDREIQNEIYLTLKKIENSSAEAQSKISVIAGIAIVYFVCSILAVIIILSK